MVRRLLPVLFGLVLQIVIALSDQMADEARKKSGGGGGKKGSDMTRLLMIPLLIQSWVMPMMLMKMKMLALKAIMLGKIAIILVVINMFRNAIIGADNIDEQYEVQTLASKHYGYTGMPEVGAWVNRRNGVVWRRRLGATHTPHR